MRYGTRAILTILLFFAGSGADCWAQAYRHPAKGRIVHFPKDRSLGKLMVQDTAVKRQIKTFGYWVTGESTNWEYFGQAMGDVVIPAGKRVQLDVSLHAVKDLSPLSELGPNDLYYLSLSFTPANDNCMPHLASLTGLKVLDLSKTNISSKGLKYIKNLKSLERLTAPDWTTSFGLARIARLPSLKGLYFYKTSRLTSKGLRYLAKLTSLEELALCGPAIGDEGLVHLAKLPSLYYLLLAGEKYSNEGLAHLRNIPNLRILNIYQFRPLTDMGLANLANLTGLERLSCHWIEGITDAGLVHIKKMHSLKMLDIGHARITDDGLAHLTDMKSLEHLHLPNFGLTDEGLGHLTKLNKLQYLWVGGRSDSPLTDKSLEHIAKLKSLEELQIGGTGITNTGMNHIAKLINLKKLTLFTAPHLTDDGLKCLSNMRKLNFLSITGDFTDAGLRHLEGLKALGYLNITSKNKFSREALDRLSYNLPNLHTFKINRNNESKRASGNKSK